MTTCLKQKTPSYPLMQTTKRCLSKKICQLRDSCTIFIIISVTKQETVIEPFSAFYYIIWNKIVHIANECNSYQVNTLAKAKT